MKTKSKETFQRNYFRSLLLISMAFVGILILVLGARHDLALAGDNIWTWAGVSGYFEQIASDPLNPNIIYARSSDAKIMRTIDGGSSWIDVADPGWTNVFRIATSPNSANVLYASSQLGVYRSTNSGDSWQEIHDATSAFSIAVSPADPNEIFIGTSVISKTVDGGQTWRTISSPLPQDYSFMHIAIAPSAPHILIASPWNTSELLPFKSTDGGETWVELTNAPMHINSIAFDPKSSNIIYLATINLSWKSIDGGNTWQPLANGLAPFVFGFVIDPDNTQVIHAANGSAGVLESMDGGASWLPINSGIQGLNVECISIGSRQPLKIFAGIRGGGVWEMTRTTVQDYSISINSGALYTNQTAVDLTMTAPPGTTEMIISNDGGFSGAAWEPYAYQKTWSITEYGDYPIPRVVYIKFKTNGLVSGLYQDDIVLDKNAPTGSILITNTSGSLSAESFHFPQDIQFAPTNALTNTIFLPIVMKNAHPGFLQVGLELSAMDDLSGVGEMMLSNQADFLDAQWETFTSKTNWWVPENGTTTTYVKYRDRAGNESPVYSDSITP